MAEVSARRRAELQSAYEATNYRAGGPSGDILIVVGQPCHKLDGILRAMGLSQWAFVSAENPGSVRCSAQENRARHARLLDRLGILGYAYFPAWGEPAGTHWESETSVLILGIVRADALALAREFGQLAIVCGSVGETAFLQWC